MAHTNLAESLSAILICMAVASMCFTTCYVYKNSNSYNWMVTILIMLIISAIVRVIERFNYTESFFSPTGDTYGLIIGIEIAVTWSTLLLAEFLIAMKFFQVSSQMPAVVSGQKSFNEIDTKSQRTAITIGVIAQIAVSIWPGVLYATTFYKKEHADLRSIFWEFEISIWLNALCRLISLSIFAVSMCRIGNCIKSMPS